MLIRHNQYPGPVHRAHIIVRRDGRLILYEALNGHNIRVSCEK